MRRRKHKEPDAMTTNTTPSGATAPAAITKPSNAQPEQAEAEPAPLPKFDPMACLVDVLQGLAKIAQAQQAAGPLNPTSPAWAKLYKTIDGHLALAGISLARPAAPATKVNTPYVKQPQRTLGAARGATQPGSRTPVK
jgi:hypothetical protein